ncbi:hypothetical protein CS063_11725 [Sporanaerobium hydrogeniformans]|uniref:Uncharacterized protein n=1 Tax=Sporanaerobium hydrogeniformans TaxID=3072179 RepID=A0AC61DA85_9FIRM|nr:hypothetical protein [Sporanaerobium hydrogeniformans]PHV70139.1 hypothetical protein CS063_11725 [Sporanaerobium hydrogeniformans]
MRRWCRVVGIICLALSVGTGALASTATYLDGEEYSDALNDRFMEESGLVLENNPQLGYITYRTKEGYTLTRNYYKEEVTVEKQPYYESEDRIGYIDELFPNFEFDPRDTTIEHIQPGDYIYVRVNKESLITYVSAFNDYMMRYGKVTSFTFNSGDTATILIEDEKGRSYSYRVELYTPVTKGGRTIALSEIKEGDWVKALIAQRIMGEGIINETLQELVVDNNTRYISNVYRGQVASINSTRQLLNVRNMQALGKLGWGPYHTLFSLTMNPKKVEAYYLGSPVSVDYVSKNLRNAGGYVYVAAEQYMGKENAVKLNFQSKLQTVLPKTMVTYADPTSVRLLSGEKLVLAKDSMIVRDKRLIEPHSIMVGDMLQAVVSGENRLIVGNITTAVATGDLQVYRGRIKRIAQREEFEVETFSMLEDSLWYFYPSPRTFTIDYETQFVGTEGGNATSIESFLDYGENTAKDDVFTIVAIGDKAYRIVDMPYVKESLKGEVYEVAEGSIKLKDVYYYHRMQKRWMEYSSKNIGATVTVAPNSVIIKAGKVMPVTRLEKGDKIRAMLDTNLKTATEGTTAYIIVVEE